MNSSLEQICLELWIVFSIVAGFCDCLAIYASSVTPLCCYLLKLNKQAVVYLDVAETVSVTTKFLAVGIQYNLSAVCILVNSLSYEWK